MLFRSGLLAVVLGLLSLSQSTVVRADEAYQGQKEYRTSLREMGDVRVRAEASLQFAAMETACVVSTGFVAVNAVAESVPLLPLAAYGITATALGKPKLLSGSAGVGVVVGGPLAAVADLPIMFFDWLGDGELAEGDYDKPFQLARETYQATRMLAGHTYSNQSACGKSYAKLVDAIEERERREYLKEDARSKLAEAKSPKQLQAEMDRVLNDTSTFSHNGFYAK